MNLTLSDNNYSELIVSERIKHHNDEELWQKVKDMVSQYPDAYMVACRDIGKEEGKYHAHIFIQRNQLTYKKTTFRNQIQKIFGVSNTRWDWKLKNKKKTSTVEQMFRYITKGADLLALSPGAEELYNQHKGLYVPFKPEGQKTLISTLRENIIRCKTCKDFNNELCLMDCSDAVIKYYNDNNKVYDLYRMKNITQTLYFRENQNELRDKLTKNPENESYSDYKNYS
jgi:hypothetical protein